MIFKKLDSSICAKLYVKSYIRHLKFIEDIAALKYKIKSCLNFNSL